MYIYCVNIFFVKVFLFKFVSLYVVFVELSSETTTSRAMLIFFVSLLIYLPRKVVLAFGLVHLSDCYITRLIVTITSEKLFWTRCDYSYGIKL